jgi:hypothetical protein
MNRMTKNQPIVAAAARALPRRLNVYLGLVAGALVAAYVVIMVITILLAALETQLSQNIQTKQMAIQKLESSYFASINELDSTDPAALGYVTPKHVAYVAATEAQGLSFAK